MNGFADVILLAVIAGAIIVQLIRALGNTKYDNGARPAEDSAEQQARPDASDAVSATTQAVAPEEEPFADEIEKIRKHDPRFSLRHFLDGAETAFSMIVEAFAKGDKATLESLTGDDLYKAFSSAIDERNAKGQTQETLLVKIAQTSCKHVELDRHLCRIVASFISEQIVHTKDKEGNTASGHPSRIHHVHDVWTFERNVRKADPTWRLVRSFSEEENTGSTV
ncbi:MAG: Tim44/TimA family putative adaptor protein [Rickettsiales bacterium]